MTAQDWRDRGRVELELPSGMKVLARRPGPLQLAEWQRLPMQLAAAVAGEGAAVQQNLTETAEYIRRIVSWCVIAPKVPEEILPDDIPAEDLNFIWRWALRVEEGARLEGFRQERRDAGAGGDGGEIRAATERPGGDLGPGDGIEF